VPASVPRLETKAITGAFLNQSLKPHSWTPSLDGAVNKRFLSTGETLGYHLKTGHTLSLQNRPTDLTQDKNTQHVQIPEHNCIRESSGASRSHFVAFA
jgi:hypothetical protein